MLSSELGTFKQFECDLIGNIVIKAQLNSVNQHVTKDSHLNTVHVSNETKQRGTTDIQSRPIKLPAVWVVPV